LSPFTSTFVAKMRAAVKLKLRSGLLILQNSHELVQHFVDGLSVFQLFKRHFLNLGFQYFILSGIASREHFLVTTISTVRESSGVAYVPPLDEVFVVNYQN
jgi:hypothetical protein